jgi:hypothetical protein
MDSRGLARAQGWFNIANGMWPLVSMRSFEKVLGPKAEHWLVRTVAGLLVTSGIAQVRSSSIAQASDARRVGLGTAATLGIIDVRYALPGRIRRIYLLDALLEAGWIMAWLRSSRDSRADLERQARSKFARRPR